MIFIVVRRPYIMSFVAQTVIIVKPGLSLLFELLVLTVDRCINHVSCVLCLQPTILLANAVQPQNVQEG